MTQLAFKLYPPSLTWACLDCSWRTRAPAPISHEQVRIHHTVTKHALAPRGQR
jgi:hypothetical protein